MPRFRESLLSVRDLAATAAPFVLLALLLLWIAFKVLQPTPPKKVVLATGPEQGAYAEFGKRYAEELKRFGIDVELRTTAGAAENLKLLRDQSSGVDIAFMQGGASEALYRIDEEGIGPPLVSLGNLFYEPVWVFYRDDAARRVLGARAKGTPVLRSLTELRGMRLNIGAEGSGAANLMNKLLHANRVEPADLTLSYLPPTPAVVALLGGEIDALAFVSAPEAPLVRMLVATPGIHLVNLSQAQAYARRFTFLSAVDLPRGVVDLAADVPPDTINLVAATSTLVARESLHPALVQLFVQAARRIHGETSWFGPTGQFPNADVTEYPLAKEADRFFRSGPPLLQRHLPFWLANLVDRMWVVLLSIIAVLIPLSRVVPPLYEFRIRSRVFRWYRRLREIEEAGGAGAVPSAELLRELEALDARVERLSVPLSHADELYALRSHIVLVRRRLLGRAAPADTPAT
ncbi:MAG: TAXI family TRAP transporter solute-binding subunit [Burkholderiaceae bacterium]|nr:TAXI family TRAP transporter solute-binding subunit [Burkholderiaceae bacterium]